MILLRKGSLHMHLNNFSSEHILKICLLLPRCRGLFWQHCCLETSTYLARSSGLFDKVEDGYEPYPVDEDFDDPLKNGTEHNEVECLSDSNSYERDDGDSAFIMHENADGLIDKCLEEVKERSNDKKEKFKNSDEKVVEGSSDKKGVKRSSNQKKVKRSSNKKIVKRSSGMKKVKKSFDMKEEVKRSSDKEEVESSSQKNEEVKRRSDKKGGKRSSDKKIVKRSSVKKKVKRNFDKKEEVKRSSDKAEEVESNSDENEEVERSSDKKEGKRSFVKKRVKRSFVKKKVKSSSDKEEEVESSSDENEDIGRSSDKKKSSNNLLKKNNKKRKRIRSPKIYSPLELKKKIIADGSLLDSGLRLAFLDDHAEKHEYVHITAAEEDEEIDVGWEEPPIKFFTELFSDPIDINEDSEDDDDLDDIDFDDDVDLFDDIHIPNICMPSTNQDVDNVTNDDCVEVDPLTANVMSTLQERTAVMSKRPRPFSVESSSDDEPTRKVRIISSSVSEVSSKEDDSSDDVVFVSSTLPENIKSKQKQPAKVKKKAILIDKHSLRTVVKPIGGSGKSILKLLPQKGNVKSSSDSLDKLNQDNSPYSSIKPVPEDDSRFIKLADMNGTDTKKKTNGNLICSIKPQGQPSVKLLPMSVVTNSKPHLLQPVPMKKIVLNPSASGTTPLKSNIILKSPAYSKIVVSRDGKLSQSKLITSPVQSSTVSNQSPSTANPPIIKLPQVKLNTTFKCQFCKNIFLKQETLKIHLTTRHKEQLKTLTSNPNSVCISLKNNKKIVIVPKDTKITESKPFLVTLSDFLEIERELKDRSLNCTECHRGMWCVSHLKKHSREHLYGDETCSTCLQSGVVYKKYMSHLETHAPDSGSNCEIISLID